MSALVDVGAAELPFCSVIIPTHRRPDALTRCLAALAELDYPGDLFEVIVVDDGGGASLETTLAPFRDRLCLRLVHQPHGGPGSARNSAAAEARGQLLVLTDDDCLPEPSWLRELAKRGGGDPTCAVGGRTINALPDNSYSRVSQLVLHLVYAHYNADGERPHFFTSNNLAVPADGYSEVGGFDPELPTAEDRDLCDRWLGLGNRMAYAPDAVVRHAADLSFTSFVQKHFRYGRGAFRFQASGRSHSSRRRAVLGFYAALPRTLRRVPEATSKDAALLVLWQIANAAGFAWEAVMSTSRRLTARQP